MSDGAVRVEYDGHLAVLTLDRPDQLNAMSDHMERQLWDAFEALDARDDVYCVLWRAEGRAFSAGRDVSELGNRGDVAARGSCVASEPARPRDAPGAEGHPRRAARADARVHVGGLRGVPRRPRRGPPAQLPHHLTTCRLGVRRPRMSRSGHAKTE